MYFAGKYSKFDEGQQVFLRVPNTTLFLPSTIKSIGILGSKLSEHLFLYNVTAIDGKVFHVTEEALSTDAGGYHEEKALNLTLKYEWYDMIESGEKTEEYREIKQSWFSKLCYYPEIEADDLDLLMQYLRGPFSEYPIDLPYINRGGGNHIRTDSNGIPIQDISSVFKFSLAICKYQKVVFHRGYTKDKMVFDLKSISIGKGNPELGAPTDRNVFILKLGKRCE